MLLLFDSSIDRSRQTKIYRDVSFSNLIRFTRNDWENELFLTITIKKDIQKLERK